jgi:hypothetical protein
MKKVLTLLSLTVSLCLIVAGNAGADRHGSGTHSGHGGGGTGITGMVKDIATGRRFQGLSSVTAPKALPLTARAIIR